MLLFWPRLFIAAAIFFRRCLPAPDGWKKSVLPEPMVAMPAMDRVVVTMDDADDGDEEEEEDLSQYPLADNKSGEFKMEDFFDRAQKGKRKDKEDLDYAADDELGLNEVANDGKNEDENVDEDEDVDEDSDDDLELNLEIGAGEAAADDDRTELDGTGKQSKKRGKGKKKGECLVDGDCKKKQKKKSKLPLPLVCKDKKCVNPTKCRESESGQRRIGPSGKGLNFQYFEKCHKGAWVAKKCPDDHIFWNSIGCCVFKDDFPCLDNCVEIKRKRKKKREKKKTQLLGNDTVLWNEKRKDQKEKRDGKSKKRTEKETLKGNSKVKPAAKASLA